jgi:DNA-binding CsgD family transcriptional regulator
MIHRAEILIFDGHWDEAGREAGAASARLQQSLAKHHAGQAVYQEGEIFRLRGQFDEADAAYRVASGLGFDPQPGLALLRLRQGRGQPALSAIRRALQSVEDVPGRLRLLPAAVEITVAVGSTEDAQALCDALQTCAQQCPSGVVRAAAAEAMVRVLLHQGQAGEALAHVRRAADQLREIRAPYLLARVRVLAAQVFFGIGDFEGARNELDAAIEIFHDLGARPDEADAKKLRTSLASSRDGGLTRRQIEILQLVATGKTNPEIAAELGLSHRTVDRHVSDILTRLNVPTRAAATAHALSQGLIDAGGAG